MSYIQTKRNRVYLSKPLPTDTVVATYLHGTFGPRHLLCVQPIANYQRSINWALRMADYMAGPIDLMTYESEEALYHAHLMADASMWAHAGEDPAVRQQGRELLMSLADWSVIKARRLQ